MINSAVKKRPIYLFISLLGQKGETNVELHCGAGSIASRLAHAAFHPIQNNFNRRSKKRDYERKRIATPKCCQCTTTLQFLYHSIKYCGEAILPACWDQELGEIQLRVLTRQLSWIRYLWHLCFYCKGLTSVLSWLLLFYFGISSYNFFEACPN